MASKKNKQRMINRYLAWRKTVPLVWRILADIGMIVLVYYVATTALYMIILLLPLLAFLGLAKAGDKSTNSDEQWYEDNDRMGGQPKSHGAATSSISA